jgi:integrase
MGDGELIIGPPKTAAGRRVVAIPAALLPCLRQHLADFVGEDPEALLFAGPKGGAPRRSNFQRQWSRALAAADLPSTVHIHDLRHTGNTLAAQSGATLSDLMARMGHESTRAARIYLHTTSQRDRDVAAALNEMLPPPTGT